mgnify:CR=1 FL=1
MKYLFVHGKEGKTIITEQSKATSVKEMFTDFLAFYKDNDLIAIIPKSEITAIFTMEEVE